MFLWSANDVLAGVWGSKNHQERLFIMGSLSSKARMPARPQNYPLEAIFFGRKYVKLNMSGFFLTKGPSIYYVVRFNFFWAPL